MPSSAEQRTTECVRILTRRPGPPHRPWNNAWNVEWPRVLPTAAHGRRARRPDRPGNVKIASRAAVAPFAVMQIIAAANARRAAGEQVLNLAAGEPAGGAGRTVREHAARLLASEDLGYTETLGAPDLREALASHYQDWYGLAVDPAVIAATTGSSGAFTLAFLACFEPGDRVALARPGYPAYRNILSALGCRVVDLACGPTTRYQPTVSMLDAAGPLEGLILASPANPTGTMIHPRELAEIAAWCAANGTRLISDEIYHGITYGQDCPPTAARFRSTGAIVVNSFSKFWAMTGWRLGWMVLPDDLVGVVDSLAGNLALCPPALAQHAAVAALSRDGMAEARARVAGYAASRELLLARLPDLGWADAAPADGAFYLYADISANGLDSVTWCRRLLEEAGVALTPGTDFDPVDGHRYVRLSFASSPAAVSAAVDRIIAWQATSRERP